MYSKIAVDSVRPFRTPVTQPCAIPPAHNIQGVANALHSHSYRKEVVRSVTDQIKPRRRYLAEDAYASECIEFPSVDPIKQCTIGDVPVREYVQQGFSDYVKAAYYASKIPTGPIVRTVTLLVEAKEVFLEWVRVIYDAVKAALESTVDTLVIWLTTVKAFIEAACSYTGKKLCQLWDFIKCLFAVSGQKEEDLAPAVGEVMADEKARLKEKNAAVASKNMSPESIPQDECDEEAFDMQAGDDDPWYVRMPEQALKIIEAITKGLLTFTEKFVDGFTNDTLGRVTRSFNSLSNAWFALGRLDIIGKAGWLVDVLYHAVTGKHLFLKYEVINKFAETHREVAALLEKAEPLRNPPHGLQSMIGVKWSVLVNLYTAVLQEDPANMVMNKNIMDSLRPRADVYIGNDRAKRIKPVVLCIKGESATGKTWTTNLLVKELMPLISKLLHKTDSEDLPIFAMHAENPSSTTIACVKEKPEYDEGYRSQLFYLMNELYTPVKLEARQDWSTQFMSLTGDEPCPLNMAFGDKGKKFFQSPFIFATGNYDHHTVAVMNPTAYFRRIELDLTAKVIPHTGVFDVKKHIRFYFSPENIVCCSDKRTSPSPVLYEYHTKQSNVGKGLTYDQLLYLIAAIYIDRICYDAVSIKEEKTNLDPDLKNLCLGEVHNLSTTYLDRFEHVFHGLNAKQGLFGLKPKPSSSSSDSDSDDDTNDRANIVLDFERHQRQVKIARECCKTVAGLLARVFKTYSSEQISEAVDFNHITAKVWASFFIKNRKSIPPYQAMYATFLSSLPVFQKMDMQKFFQFVACSELSDKALEKLIVEWFTLSAPKKIIQLEGLEPLEFPNIDLSLEEGDIPFYEAQSGDLDWGAPVQATTTDYVDHYRNLLVYLCDKDLFPAMYVEAADLYKAAGEIISLCPAAFYTQKIANFSETNPWVLYARITSNQARYHKFVTSGRTKRAQFTRAEFHHIKVDLKYIYASARSIQAACTAAKRVFDEDADTRRISTGFTAAYLHFTPLQKQVAQASAKRLYGIGLTTRGRMVKLPDPVVRAYKLRVGANHTRSKTKNAALRAKRETQWAAQKSAEGSKEGAHRQEQRNKNRQGFIAHRRATKYELQGAHDFDPMFEAVQSPAVKDSTAGIHKAAKSLCTDLRFYFSDVMHTARGATPPRIHKQISKLFVLDLSIFVILEFIRINMHSIESSFSQNDCVGFCLNYRADIMEISRDWFLECFKTFWIANYQAPHNAKYNFRAFLLSLLCQKDHNVVEVYNACYELVANQYEKFAERPQELKDSIMCVVTKTTKIDRQFVRNYVDVQAGLTILGVISAFVVGAVGPIMLTVIAVMCHRLAQFINPSTLPEFGEPDLQACIDKIALAGYSVHLKPLEKVLDEQVASKDEDKDKKPKKVQVDNFSRRMRMDLARQGANDASTIKITRNQYALFSQMGTKIGEGTFIGGQVMVLPYHVYKSMRTFRALPLVSENNPSYDLPASNMALIEFDEANDTAYIMVKGVQNRANISSFIMDPAGLEQTLVMERCMISFWDNNPGCKVDGDFVPIGDVRPVLKPRKLYKTAESIIEKHGSYLWKGNYAGACGALIMSYVANVPTVVGMHVGGSNQGQCACVFFDRKIAKSIMPGPDQLPKYRMDPATMAFVHDDPVHGMYEFTQQGFVTPIKTIATDSTVYRPTPFSDFGFKGGAPKIPADLTYDALENALEKDKRMDVVLEFKPEAHRLIEEHAEIIVAKFLPLGKNTVAGCKTLSFEESMYGYKNLDRFDASSSRGLRLKHWQIKKDSLFDTETPRDPIAVAFVKRKVQQIVDSFAQGNYTYQLNVQKLKDELRSLDRVAAKMSRIFNITDFIDNVLIKMALGDLVSKTKGQFLHGPAACGTNPRGDSWRMLFLRYLHLRVLFADVSGFDSTHTNLIFPVIRVLLTYAYNDIFQRQFAFWAIISCLYGLRFNLGKGFAAQRGNSSGNWITTWLNTLVNLCYFCVAVASMAEKNGVDPNKVLEELIIDLYSDDNLSSVPYEWYTASALSKEFQDLFGIKLTSVDKGELNDAQGLGLITDAEFLSRRFIVDDGLLLAPLSEDSLLAQLYYVRVPRKFNGGSAYIMKQLQQNLDNVSSELFEWTPPDAEKMASQIIAFISEHNLPLRFDYQANVHRADVRYL
jgi:hypothetical protein